MKTDTIVMDAGPLILLARINSLYILEQLPFDYVAPVAVSDEVDVGPLLGHPRVHAPWLRIVPTPGPTPDHISVGIDDGEAAAIYLALELGVNRVCLDDLRGRRMAKTLGLKATGLLGLLIRAKRMGIIEKVEPYTERLLEVGARYSAKVLHNVLTTVGER